MSSPPFSSFEQEDKEEEEDEDEDLDDDSTTFNKQQSIRNKALKSAPMVVYKRQKSQGMLLETTTSEGLCDHVREIFMLSRQVYNEYEVRAMRKLLARKSHSQILKDELKKQLLIISNDKHPYYKAESFQSKASYETWKASYMYGLRHLMVNFDHVKLNETSESNSNMHVHVYMDKLKLFPKYYDLLVEQIFK
jgi:hypothetical protein